MRGLVRRRTMSFSKRSFSASFESRRRKRRFCKAKDAARGMRRSPRIPALRRHRRHAGGALESGVSRARGERVEYPRASPYTKGCVHAKFAEPSTCTPSTKRDRATRYSRTSLAIAPVFSSSPIPRHSNRSYARPSRGARSAPYGLREPHMPGGSFAALPGTRRGGWVRRARRSLRAAK